VTAWVGPALFAVRAWWRDLGSAWSTRGLSSEINPGFNLRADDRRAFGADHGAMTITDYLINAVFVLIVFRQARERELDRRSVIIPLAIIVYVAHLYVRSIPTAGNDLVLIGALGAVGLALGVASGFATQVRAGEDGLAVARVGWIAGGLLIAGIGSRMVFAFALSHGAHHAVASFSFAHQIGAAAWPVALVLMALLEVSTRIAIVQLRGRHAVRSSVAIPAAA
jgi:hypothetical protein